MAINLNHTIVHAKDPEASSLFFSEILGLPKPVEFYHFKVVETANGVSLDFLQTDDEIQTQHYAFLVNDEEFDQIFERIKERRISYWADPMASKKNEINNLFGGRGFYFRDPSGHYLEVITKPYAR